MAAIPYVGKCFATAAEFSDYLETIHFTSWRPRFITLHHTGIPDLKMWNGWQGRVSDSQWLKNLASYYGNTMHWSAAPQFFFTPKHYCVLSLPEKRGVHAVAFNSNSWGVEAVGNFDREPFEGVMRDRIIEGLACLHVATGFTPDFVKNVRGLHFHRDDPTTRKTCPGTHVAREPLIAAIKAKMDDMTPGDHPDETATENGSASLPEPPNAPAGNKTPEGAVAASDGLNLREAASARAPVAALLPDKQRVAIIGEAMNGSTKWLKVWLRVDGTAHVGWVASDFVKRD